MSAALLLALAAVSGWTAERSPLFGKWQLAGQGVSLTIEFNADGRYTAISKTGLDTGFWAAETKPDPAGEGVLGTIATWKNSLQPKKVNDFRVDGDLLFIIDGERRIHRHRRIR